MPNTPEDFDERFGKFMAATRKRRNLSQRELSRALAKRGMKVDVPAISRIENGSRSVRFAEAMTIADVLDADIAGVVELHRTPEQNFRRLRNDAAQKSYAARSALLDMLRAALTVRQHLVDHPDYLDRVTGEGQAPLGSAEEYLGWVSDRVLSTATSPYLALDTEGEKEEARRLVAAIVESIFLPGTGSDTDEFEYVHDDADEVGGFVYRTLPWDGTGGDGEHQETSER